MKFFSKLILTVTLLILPLSLVSCSQTTSKIRYDNNASDINSAIAENYNGPKARIAVLKFADKTGGNLIDENFTSGIADMLTSALFNTNRYIILDREDLNAILLEQDLSAGSRVSDETLVKIRDIEGAELLIFGAVTGYKPKYFSAGGIALGILSALGSIVASMQNEKLIGGYATYSESYIAIDIKIVDTKTGRVVYAGAVEGKGKKMHGGVFGSIGLGGGSQTLLALGSSAKSSAEMKAIRVCIDTATVDIVKNTPYEFYREPSTSNSFANTASFIGHKVIEPLPPSANALNFPKREFLIINNQKDYRSLMTKLGIPVQNQRYVDFTKSRIIALFGGKKKSPFWAVGIKKIVKNPEGLFITAKEIEFSEIYQKDKEEAETQTAIKAKNKQVKPTDPKLNYPFELSIVDDLKTPIKKLSWENS